MPHNLLSRPPLPRKSLALFCRVIDNFGDIGVCWRLARQLAHEYGMQVQLWVDDLHSFRQICPQVQPDLAQQQLQGVEVLAWREDAFAADANTGAVDWAGQVCDIVIEGFGCHLPDAYLSAMTQCRPAPVWLNLEYLSAEDWVESCHGLPSPHPQTGLLKYFYFPGFSAATGGLLAEGDLLARRTALQDDAAAQARFWRELGVQPRREELKMSMFCYRHAPLTSLFAAWQAGEQPVLCLLPQGVASEAAQAFLAQPPVAGAQAQRGALRLQIVPFVAQAQYDFLLWACDLNFVRGEDSFVRAQWAARPFIWQIYPQQEGVHLEKLAAFLQRYCQSMPPAAAQACMALSQAWNAAMAGAEINAEGKSALAPALDALPSAWRQFAAHRSSLTLHAQDWAQMLAKNGDLAARLMQFVKKIG